MDPITLAAVGVAVAFFLFCLVVVCTSLGQNRDGAGLDDWLELELGTGEDAAVEDGGAATERAADREAQRVTRWFDPHLFI